MKRPLTPRRAWAIAEDCQPSKELLPLADTKIAPWNVPVLVIPLTKEAVAKLQLKLAIADCKRRGFGQSWLGISKQQYQGYMQDAMEALRAIGIRTPRKTL